MIGALFGCTATLAHEGRGIDLEAVIVEFEEGAVGLDAGLDDADRSVADEPCGILETVPLKAHGDEPIDVDPHGAAPHVFGIVSIVPPGHRCDGERRAEGVGIGQVFRKALGLGL